MFTIVKWLRENAPVAMDIDQYNQNIESIRKLALDFEQKLGTGDKSFGEFCANQRSKDGKQWEECDTMQALLNLLQDSDSLKNKILLAREGRTKAGVALGHLNQAIEDQKKSQGRAQ